MPTELDLRYTKKLHKRRMTDKTREAVFGYAFIAVPVIGFLVFTLSALGYSLFMSFTNFNPIKNVFTFVGFENYASIFKDEFFIKAFGNTWIMLLSIPIGTFLGFLLAIYLNKLARGRVILMILYYLPAVTSSIAIMLVFRDIFRSDNWLINSLFGMDLKWLGADPWLIKIAIIIKNVWGSIGGSMILYLAILITIPKSYYESARVSGAKPLHGFVDITMPMSNSTTFYIITTGIMTGLQSYADSAIFGNGLPGSRTIVYYIWENGINSAQYGYASAAGMILAFMILIITLFLFAFSPIFRSNIK